MEALHLMDIYKPTNNSFDLIQIYFNSVENMTKPRNTSIGLMEVHFFKLMWKLFDPKSAHQLHWVFFMIFTRSSMDKNIIKINNNKLFNERLQYLCHDLYECTWALLNLNGITNHSYNPFFVLKVAFHSFPSLICTWWYQIPIFEKITNPTIISSMPSSVGIGNWYLIVILLISQLSTHICYDRSLFGVSRVGTP